MSVAIITGLVILLDTFSKSWATINLMGTEGFNVLGKFLQFHYVENKGAAFGIFNGQKWILTLLTIIIILGLIYFWARQPKHQLTNLAVGLILGGAFGNLCDRILNGFVVDFIMVDIVDFYNFPVFNVADIAICIGVFIFIIHYLFIEKNFDFN